MKKSVVWLCSALIFSSMVLVACQKQDDTKLLMQQQPSSATHMARLNSGKDYRIPTDSAIAYTNAWIERNKAAGIKEGDYPVAITIDRAAFEQIFSSAEAQGINVEKVRFYPAIKNGQVTLVYAGITANDNIVPALESASHRFESSLYDDGYPCSTNCLLANNIPDKL